jgi:hypothetical protein
LIVSTGTNDIDNPTTNINNIITPLITFIDIFEHTNIIIVNIPIRYDLGHDLDSISKKKKIVRYNEKLHKLLNLYTYVSIVEASSNRDYYTKHGLHLNNYGKEKLVKQIVSQINSVKRTANPKTPILLLWKENAEEKVAVNEDKSLNVLLNVLFSVMIISVLFSVMISSVLFNVMISSVLFSVIISGVLLKNYLLT